MTTTAKPAAKADVKAKSNPPFRAEHIGSLLRPEGLRRARERILGAHTYDHAIAAHNNPELREIEDRAIEDVIALQEQVGLPVVTDGEFRRRTWWTDFVLGIDGIVENVGREAKVVFLDKNGHRHTIPSVIVTGKVGWPNSIMRDAFRFLKDRTKRTAKVTIPAPTNIHYFIGGDAGVDRKAYPEIGAFFEDLAAAYRREIEDLAHAGCTYLQLDDVAIGFLCDPERQEQVRSWGYEPDALLDIYIELFNRSVAERPTNMTIGMHICRGNANSHWGASGGYDPVAEALFGKLDVDAFLLEYDTERAGGFEPLRFVPAHKRVVLGLISTKTPVMETKANVTEKISRASKILPLEQLSVSPQCGFGSNYIGNPVTVDDERKKLELVVQVAAEVWGKD